EASIRESTSTDWSRSDGSSPKHSPGATPSPPETQIVGVGRASAPTAITADRSTNSSQRKETMMSEVRPTRMQSTDPTDSTDSPEGRAVASAKSPPGEKTTTVTQTPEKPRRRDRFTIAGMPYLYFGGLFITFLIAALTDNLPDSMLIGFGVTIVLGGVLMAIGERIPKVRDFGLPTLLCTFVPAILIYLDVMPASIPPVVTNFLDGYGFLDFFVVAVIAGSVLGMPRALLLKAGPRFLIPLLGCIVITFAAIGAIAAVLGFGFIEGILFVAGAIMAGGLGVGAIPMSQMYAAQTGTDASVFMADLMAALVIGNIRSEEH